MELDLLGQPIVKKQDAYKPVTAVAPGRDTEIIVHRPYSVTKLGKYQAMVVNDDCAAYFKPSAHVAGQSS